MTLFLFDYEFQTQISLFVLYNKINIRTDVILFLAGGRRGKEVKKNINAAGKQRRGTGDSGTL